MSKIGEFRAGVGGDSNNGMIRYDPAWGTVNYLGKGRYSRGNANSTLAHEISHAWDFYFNAGKRDEGKAIQIQNQIRYINRESILNMYGTGTVINYDALIPRNHGLPIGF